MESMLLTSKQELDEGVREVIFGQSGSGKSTLARAKLIQYVIGNYRDRYYVIDVNKTHIRGNPFLEGLGGLGFKPIYINYTTLSAAPPKDVDFIDKLYALNERWNEVLDKIPRAVIVIELPPDLTSITANAIARAILEKGNAAVLLDEVSKLVPATRRDVDDIGMLICSGRGSGIDTISVAQHRNLSNKIFMQEANWVTTFKTMDELDLTYLKDRFGEKTSMIKELDSSRKEFATARMKDGKVYKSDLNQFLMMLKRRPSV